MRIRQQATIEALIHRLNTELDDRGWLLDHERPADTVIYIREPHGSMFSSAIPQDPAEYVAKDGEVIVASLEITGKPTMEIQLIIGRSGHVERFEVAVDATPDEIAERLYRLSRPWLASRDVEARWDPGTKTGAVFAGFHAVGHARPVE